MTGARQRWVQFFFFHIDMSIFEYKSKYERFSLYYYCKVDEKYGFRIKMNSKIFILCGSNSYFILI